MGKAASMREIRALGGKTFMARLGKGKWAEGIAVEVPRVIIALEGHYHLQ